ncbi:hypothetical protein SAMN06265365_103198 [Tistlia consotensis]|uniref:Uncharacterized protein n=1 Tax=Tistlia consotensis USBA 355 TaxID=560819 RepID=A0A1Y6BKM1_9PROT|nr:hypothetical protein [Tistlia consotensis]SMF16144.1 hypothetical protein SAMN05428998_10629 [Tistlia consotensis USBA 355]SNR41370.1 hypothetical protein SAMN06265365_103198 [Tistlia consotensis]
MQLALWFAATTVLFPPCVTIAFVAWVAVRERGRTGWRFWMARGARLALLCYVSGAALVLWWAIFGDLAPTGGGPIRELVAFVAKPALYGSGLAALALVLGLLLRSVVMLTRPRRGEIADSGEALAAATRALATSPIARSEAWGLRRGWRRRARAVGRLALLCYAFAFVVHLLILLSHLPQDAACADGWYGSMAPQGMMDLREVVGLPCKLRPLGAAATLLATPLYGVPVLLPAALGFALAFRKLGRVIRQAWQEEAAAGRSGALRMLRSDWRAWAGTAGWLLLAAYLLAFLMNLDVVIWEGIGSHWQKPMSLCLYDVGYKSAGLPDLRPLGWPCVLDVEQVAVWLYLMPLFWTPVVLMAALVLLPVPLLLLWRLLLALRRLLVGGPGGGSPDGAVGQGGAG